MRASLQLQGGSLRFGPSECVQRSTGTAPTPLATSCSSRAQPTPALCCCAVPASHRRAPLTPLDSLSQPSLRITAGAAPCAASVAPRAGFETRRAGVVCHGFFNFNLGGRGGDKDREEARARQERERREQEEREQREGSKEGNEDEEEEDRKAAATLASILRASLGLESDDKPRPNEVERSEMVNEEMVYFIFQMDLDVQLQRALNYEAYEFAQGVRAKRQRVDEALNEMMQRKAENVGGEAAAAALDTSELAEEGLKLRAQMQKAVEEERYSDAARIRDMLADLERRSKKAEALAAEFTPTGAQRQFRLGQRVKHRKFGYRGVVVGWDAQCCESDEWACAVGVADLPRGSKQPFYQLLVDVRDWTFNYTLPPVAYAAEDLLWAPELGGPEGMEVYEAQSTTSSPTSAASSAAEESSQSSASKIASSSGRKEGPQPGQPMSWVERFGEGGLRHPYEYMLFLGQDARGDYLPCKQLRDRYNVQRRDVWAPGQDGTEDDDDEDGSGPGDFFSPPD